MNLQINKTLNILGLFIDEIKKQTADLEDGYALDCTELQAMNKGFTLQVKRPDGLSVYIDHKVGTGTTRAIVGGEAVCVPGAERNDEVILFASPLAAIPCMVGFELFPNTDLPVAAAAITAGAMSLLYHLVPKEASA